MSIALSRTSITSFCGDVLPLHINFREEGHDELKKADIEWSSSNDCVVLRSFSGDGEFNFNNGVLLLLNKVGKATVTARLSGKEYSCEVTVEEMKKASSEGKLNYYIGDLHDHTTNIHKGAEFKTREIERLCEYVDYIKEVNNIDFGVISDHAGISSDSDFFEGFTLTEKAQPMGTVLFPGAESEVIYLEEDRFGIPRRLSGEIVTINAGSYACSKTWDVFEKAFESSPLPIAIFAHPQIIAFSSKGMADFSYHERRTPTMLRIIRGIEMGDGSERQQNLIHEYAYSIALDNGFRVSTTCSSDSHGANSSDPNGPKWGYHRFPGKTVIMAKEKSKEAFVDALRNNRFYATESGNVKLRYTVNGMCAPCDLEVATKYKFHVELSYFKDDETTKPINCKVVSDGGEVVKTLENIDFSSFDFEIDSDSARYFYLRFIDEKGRRTWSMPVWTGREFDVYVKPDVAPIDMSRCTAVELVSGADASAVIDGDPENTWEADNDAPSILIDMKEELEISAVGNYNRILDRKKIEVNLTKFSYLFTAGIPTDIEVWTSLDGKNFEKRARAKNRAFSGEQIITFERIRARYLRFDVLSTVGNDNVPKNYGGTNVGIGNIAIFK